MRQLNGAAYFRVAVAMPRHPKVDPLSDRAFRTLVEIWAYCAEQYTDGVIDGRTARKTYRRAALLELEKAGLLEARGDDWYCHDFTDWQMTSVEVATAIAQRGAGGARAAHVRWHTNRGRSDPDCPYCEQPP